MAADRDLDTRGAHSPPYVQEYVLHPTHPFPHHLDVLCLYSQ